ncbi:hypothetical protein POTOM_005626 [Populus tomentosa]|uniref:Uncharacterized protein n=1 Tax=Populus tomentosa TaxID=118781 RepID=A0A8X8AHF3_POPTO|nr:hypothetical protein POTOM_005626 [Populus tomentosa]
MEMKKIACAILFAAASVSAVMADEVAAPAPSPTSGVSASLPVVGSLAVMGEWANGYCFHLLRLIVLAYDDVLAPMPAMATGSAAGYSASVAAMGFSLMVYVFEDDLLMQFESSKLKSTTD